MDDVLAYAEQLARYAQDGAPAGSVWFAVETESGQQVSHQVFDGEPERVLERTVEFALRMLLYTCHELGGE
ncbi:hypothetical protein HLB23_11725 [Nocardia uniformis]|uniref:CinA C-terminal domain-containing protein n=1 Tax=Nocardia uniformis TaxID=53432 RepID=A0A849BWC4_9NOCA|nr:CinA family protein [Nocardia uniformis]NNH70524.1 hypothetical protein [Nocardia uniformis]